MFDLMPFENRQRSLAKYFDDMEKSFFGDFANGLGMSEFKTDILDKGDRYVLQAELPGFQKEDIHIDLNGDVLTIRAQHQESSEEKDKKGNFIRRERRYGSFSRNFDVSGIHTDEISANYNNGVLELELPKASPQNPTSRRIELR